MRRRGNTKKGMEEEEEEEEGESVEKKEGVEEVVKEGGGVEEVEVKDPLKWFGILVPQSLRQSQQYFSKGSIIHIFPYILFHFSFRFLSINNCPFSILCLFLS